MHTFNSLMEILHNAHRRQGLDFSPLAAVIFFCASSCGISLSQSVLQRILRVDAGVDEHLLVIALGDGYGGAQECGHDF